MRQPSGPEPAGVKQTSRLRLPRSGIGPKADVCDSLQAKMPVAMLADFAPQETIDRRSL
jgi:hypothetical protein